MGRIFILALFMLVAWNTIPQAKTDESAHASARIRQPSPRLCGA